MGWSPDFKAALASGDYDAEYRLEWVKVPAGTLRVFGGNVRLSSYHSPGHQPLLTLDGLMISGGVLGVRDYNCNPLMFDVGVQASAPGAYDMRTMMQRGQVVALSVGLQTGDPSVGDGGRVWERVALGTVYGLSRSGAGWVIRCRGLEGSLTSRITTEAGKQSLGYDLASTDITANIAAAATTIEVTSTSGFRDDGGGVGALLIEANDGSTYYATYTGTSGGNTFTGVTLGAFGSSWSSTTTAGAGGAVSEVMYTTGHPLEIARKVLTSTGGGTNGLDDVLPASWGYGIPDYVVEDRDVLSFVGFSQPTSGADDWAWVQPAEIEDPQAALNDFLNSCGYFITQRHGSLAPRCIVKPWEDNTPGHITITDGMIVASSIRYETWNPDTPFEYEQCRVLYTDGTTAGTSASSDLDHIPARGINAHTMGGVWSGTTNAAAIVTELVARLKDWDQRTAEVLMFDLVGWWPGIAAPGDTCSLDIVVVNSRTTFDFRGQVGLITRCAPDWFGSKTQIEVVILPPDETVPWRVGA